MPALWSPPGCSTTPTACVWRRSSPSRWLTWRYELDRLLPARREELCDLNALEFTRYPPGLISALELIAEMGPAGSDGDPAVSHLWMAAPDEFQVNNAAQVTIARRLALLNEL